MWSKNSYTVAVSTELSTPLVLDTGFIETLPIHQQSLVHEFGTYSCTAKTQNGEIVETRSIHIEEKGEHYILIASLKDALLYNMFVLYTIFLYMQLPFAYLCSHKNNYNVYVTSMRITTAQ